MVKVDSASFYRRPDGKLIILCAGRFPHRALPLVARVGNVDVEAISVSADGRQFIGVLAGTPSAGDELVVRFLPEPATRSDVRFPSGPVRMA